MPDHRQARGVDVGGPVHGDVPDPGRSIGVAGPEHFFAAGVGGGDERGGPSRRPRESVQGGRPPGHAQGFGEGGAVEADPQPGYGPGPIPTAMWVTSSRSTPASATTVRIWGVRSSPWRRAASTVVRAARTRTPSGPDSHSAVVTAGVAVSKASSSTVDQPIRVCPRRVRSVCRASGRRCGGSARSACRRRAGRSVSRRSSLSHSAIPVPH